jgi:hypothetical protein
MQPSPSIGERLGAALRWLGLALVSAPFAVTLIWIVATGLLDSLPGDVPIEYFGFVPVFTGALGSLPFFLLSPWFAVRLPWLDRTVPGAVVLSAVLSLPAAIAPLLVFKGLDPAAVWIVAFCSIITPRVIAKSLRPVAPPAHPR